MKEENNIYFMDDILKYGDFINENFQDPPEEYIKTALQKLKKKIEGFFESASEEQSEEDIPQDPREESENEEEVMTFKQAIQRGEERDKSNSKMSLSEFGVNLESCELSRYSAQYDSLTIKFSDQDGWYNIFLTIPLKSVVADMKEKGEDEDYSDEDIKECSIKFKKYNLDNELVGQLGPKKYKIGEIDEEFFVNLKIEVDDAYGEDSEELEIET